MDVFDWHIRWQDPEISEGHTIEVGTGTHYLALYAPPVTKASKHKDDAYCGGLNHLTVICDDLPPTEDRIRKYFKNYSHADYGSRKRFYFSDEVGIECEVACYW